MIDFNSSIKVTTKFNAEEIRQSMVDDNDLIANHVDDVIRLKEQGVIDALIKLGWTPPKGIKGSK